MSKDKCILYFIWIVTGVLLYKFIPRNKLRQGILVMFSKQCISWFFGLLVVEKGLIKYPVRLFKKSNKMSFTFEYFIYPAFCAIFNLNYPENRNKFIKFVYYLFHVGLITCGEVLAERYTNIIKYVKWKWYWSFLTLGMTNYLSRLFYKWFFKDEFEAEPPN
ncbi:CBO0543 family protein [Pseudalkalibacillus hwajinpoensis]|uniref:CBO0543 family protein n=1 Tax=Guptibacillus hwajinpoensis TaxID=208199 RepID=UPI00325A6755